MWDLPGPGLEPVSPALVGGFLTTASPGNSPGFSFDLIYLNGTEAANLGTPMDTNKIIPKKSLWPKAEERG